MKYLATLLLFSLRAAVTAQQPTIPMLFSPDQQISVRIETGNQLRYAIFYRDKLLLLPSAMDLVLPGGIALAANAELQSIEPQRVSETIVPPVPIKRNRIPDEYNQLTLRFNGGFQVVFRAYDDGVAYRFQMQRADSLIIENEIAEFVFPKKTTLYVPEVQPREGVDVFHTSFEEPYQVLPLDSLKTGALFFSPVLADVGAPVKVVLTESDLEEYPGMFLTPSPQGLRGVFAPYPLEEQMTEGEFPQAIVSKRAGFIAKTSGTRSFPWRVLVIGDDKTLPATDLVYRLAAPNRIGDAGWIKPGQGTDEWTIGINLYNVPFKAGINTDTYKYYIDFAKRFGLERIMMDAGWSEVKDLFAINPNLNMTEIAAYAKQKGIKLSMWTLASTLERQLEPALAQFKGWGVDFVMTDFMDRDDQKMVRFYHRMAAAFAREKIMLMFHGAYKPAGLGRTYPNVVTQEGVLGSEYNIWSAKATPENNVLLPFIRMVAGPMDYEPGILDNATRETFRPIGNKVMSLGTRCHQLAMFVAYDSPIQIFSGNPSTGWQEPAFMSFLGSLPTTWDETRIADAQLGDYIVSVRKKGDVWYIGALNDWTARTITLPLDFLSEGSYELTECADGINADRYPSDYTLRTRMVQKRETLTLAFAPGGGYVARIKLYKRKK